MKTMYVCRFSLLRHVIFMLAAGCFTAVGQDKKELSGGENQVLYQHGQMLQKHLEFDSAIAQYNQCLEWAIRHRDLLQQREVRKRILECKSGVRLVGEPRKFVVTSLGSAVNSPFEDYAPVLSEDENMMVFTSRRLDGNLNKEKSSDGKYYEDIFLSRRENGIWSNAENLGKPVNSPFHNSNLALSADGRQLFTYSDENDGDILVSDYLAGQWSSPKPMPWPINTPYHESSISTDGKRYFVASERPGGQGGSDIWLIEKNPSGQWKSVNLGPAVNTTWDEDGPYIDYDGRTLYFSSNGHNSMGGFDIFRSQWNAGRWQAPENLGYPINTPGNDSYLVGTKDGKHAYYSSVRDGGMGEEDIYMITLPKELERGNRIDSLSETHAVPQANKFLTIYFDFRSSALSPEARQQLQSLLVGVKGSNELIQIEGHADSIGQESFNEGLSMARASAVSEFLKGNGVSSDRLAVKGWGTRKPAASNENEKDGRSLNRRVEISVIDN